jgi:hypothetical protein
MRWIVPLVVAGTLAGCGGGSTTTVIQQVPATTEGTTTQPASGNVLIEDIPGNKGSEPSQFAFSQDGDLVGKNLQWSSWGSSVATAKGDFVFSPRPVGSQTTTVSGTLTASGLKPCRGASYYTTVQVSFDGATPFKPDLPILLTPCS